MFNNEMENVFKMLRDRFEAIHKAAQESCYPRIRGFARACG